MICTGKQQEMSTGIIPPPPVIYIYMCVCTPLPVLWRKIRSRSCCNRTSGGSKHPPRIPTRRDAPSGEAAAATTRKRCVKHVKDVVTVRVGVEERGERTGRTPPSHTHAPWLILILRGNCILPYPHGRGRGAVQTLDEQVVGCGKIILSMLSLFFCR